MWGGGVSATCHCEHGNALRLHKLQVALKQVSLEDAIYKYIYTVKLKSCPRCGGFKVKSGPSLKLKSGPSFFTVFRIFKVFLGINRKFMKNSGLFLNMAKWCFWVCFFEVLVLLWFVFGVFGIVPGVLKMLVFPVF